MALPKVLTGFVCSLLLLGCSSMPVESESGSDLAMRRIASDLVATLTQVPALSVENTSLNLPLQQFERDGFGRALQEQLKEAGYAIRTVGSNPGDRLVSYSVDTVADDSSGGQARAPVRTYTVTIGAVSVGRQYTAFDSPEVHPVSAMQIKGAVASDLRVSDSMFAASEDAESQSDIRTEEAVSRLTESRGTTGAVAAEDDATQIDETPESSDSALAPMSTAEARRAFASRLSQLQDQPRVNFRELRRSNFSDLFDSLTLVRESLVPFGNDSIRLDPIAEEEIAFFISSFNVESDVFSVIGCSNGRTESPLGPRGLALGRAAAVTAELRRLDVPEQSILEEGCWSGEHFDEMMPRRGVVLSLRRLSNAD